MDEQKDIKETEKKETAPDTDAGDKYETTPVIERAREEREKLEAATKAQREENDRTERIMAKQALGGDGGGHVEAEAKEETPKEYRERVEKEMSEGQHGD